jgi:ubiquitin carboxyl-terminal hydrolase 4/11
VKNKPYIEKPDSTDEMVHNPAALRELADKSWEIYKARNDSVVADLFAGMYKSTLICPVCDKVSIIFDPFTNLTLQLPIENNWSKQIFYFPLHGKPMMVDVDIDKNASFLALKQFVAKRVGADAAKLVGAEIYKQKFYKMFDNVTTIAENNIQSADQIGIYEIEAIPTNYNPNKQKKGFSLSSNTKNEIPGLDEEGADRILVPIFHRLTRINNTRRGSFFGPPSYIVLTRRQAKVYDDILRKVLGTVQNMTTLSMLGDDNEFQPDINTPEDSDTVVMNDDDAVSSDSARIRDESVKDEEEMVDVSMPETRSVRPYHKTPPILRPGRRIPNQLRNLFDMKIYKSDNDAIPLGWSSLDESKELPSIEDRLKRLNQRRAQNEEGSGSTSSEETTAHDGSSDHQASGSDSEEGLPSSQKIFSRTAFGRKKKVTYSKKARRNGTLTPPPEDDGWLIRPGEAIVLDWEADAYDGLFEGKEDDAEELRGIGTWKRIDTWPDEELAATRARRQARRKNGVTLEECLNEFGKMETLSEANAWYCPRCKQHREANKKFELWKVPDILVMHLKRFSSNRSWRDKLEIQVDYPIEGLDLTGRVLEPDAGRSMTYDLIAVDNHYGGLGGGHYTAVAQNFFNKEWYDYNGKSLTFPCPLHADPNNYT